MIKAYEANRIAGSEFMQIMSLIEESAYKGGFTITLDYLISKDTIETLKEYGYKVEEINDPLYEETHYGKQSTEIVGYKKQTIISWK